MAPRQRDCADHRDQNEDRRRLEGKGVAPEQYAAELGNGPGGLSLRAGKRIAWADATISTLGGRVVAAGRGAFVW